jgi:hypothetical protein
LDYVEHYNDVRLHSAIAYLTPRAVVEGWQKEIQQKRDLKLESRREERRQQRLAETSTLAPREHVVRMKITRPALLRSNLSAVRVQS